VYFRESETEIGCIRMRVRMREREWERVHGRLFVECEGVREKVREDERAS